MEQGVGQYPTKHSMPPPQVWLYSVCRKNGLDVTNDQIGLISAYVEQLLEWNAKVNLVSRKDTDHIWQAHILHCIGILLSVEIPEGAAVLDLGSGGGLPGVPVKILRPDLKVTCLDATRKKIDVLREIVSTIKLEGIETAWGRAEDVGKTPQFKGKFNVILARAVAPLTELIKWSRPFLRSLTVTASDPPPGRIPFQAPALIALKGGDLEEELNKGRNLGGVKSLRSVPLGFIGAEQVPGIDKKIVIVEFE